MTRVSQRQLQFEQFVAQDATFRHDVGDSFGVGFEEAFRSGPTMAIGRAVQSYFDTSKELDPHSANEQFGLLGTDAAFKDGDKVTVEMAKSVSDDYYRLRLNSVVKETVNAESPIMGNISQFAGSLAAGFADPVLLAANLGGAYVAGRAGQALINSKRAFDTVSKASPTAGRLLYGAYAEGAKRSLTAIVAREGLENFVGGAIEEGVIRGFDVGEERLAVKTDWSDSMLNVIAGTVLGTTLSIPLSSEGRQALMRKFGRIYGDDAPMRIQNELQMSDIESKLGIEKSHFETRMAEAEDYNLKPWHEKDVAYTFSANNQTPTKLYVSVDDKGTIFQVDRRGAGKVLHDNPVLARNKGSRVLEIDSSNLRILRKDGIVNPEGGHTAIGRDLADRLRMDIIQKTDAAKLSQAIADDMEIPAAGVVFDAAELDTRLKTVLEGKDIDEMLEFSDSIGAATSTKYDASKIIDQFLGDSKWNGYQFVKRKSDGSGAFNGVYLLDKFEKKLKKSADIPVAKPTEGDLIKHKFNQEQMLLEYHDWMATKAGSLRQSNGDAAGIPKQTIDETITPPKNEIQETLTGSVEKKSALSAVDADLDRRIAETPDDETIKALKKLSDDVKAGKDITTMAAEFRKTLDEYDVCMRGA